MSQEILFETDADSASFGKFRRYCWPIHNFELKKFVPLLGMKFCISFIFTILHATKDTLIITAKGSGAETIPILKGGVVISFAFIFMLVYSKLSNFLSKQRLFYTTIAPFLIFFFIYGFFLYPYRELLSPHESAEWLLSTLGETRSHWVAVYRNWMDSLFFLMSELWGGVVIGLLFWGFANQINKIREASRFYTIISAGGDIGVILAGPVIWYSTALGHNHYSFTIQSLMSFVCIVCLIFMALYWWLNRAYGEKSSSDEVIAHKKKTMPSLKESFKHLLNTPQLAYIALMVVGYSLSVNMIEVIWKAILKTKYPDPNDYESFMGLLAVLTGMLSFVLAIFVSGNMIRKGGWYMSAQSTPLILGLASAAFLAIFFFNFAMSGSLVVISATALIPLIIIGSIHNIACKSMKYCLFDPTKEMAYIALDEESQVKGKAAVDVVVARFGKSGSSWIQIGSMELLGVGSILGTVPCLTPCILVAIFAWIIAIHRLNNLSKQKTLQEV